MVTFSEKRHKLIMFGMWITSQARRQPTGQAGLTMDGLRSDGPEGVRLLRLPLPRLSSGLSAVCHPPSLSLSSAIRQLSRGGLTISPSGQTGRPDWLQAAVPASHPNEESRQVARLLPSVLTPPPALTRAAVGRRADGTRLQ